MRAMRISHAIRRFCDHIWSSEKYRRDRKAHSGIGPATADDLMSVEYTFEAGKVKVTHNCQSRESETVT